MDKKSGIIFSGERRAGSVYFASFQDFSPKKEIPLEKQKEVREKVFLLLAVNPPARIFLDDKKTTQARATPKVNRLPPSLIPLYLPASLSLENKEPEAIRKTEIRKEVIKKPQEKKTENKQYDGIRKETKGRYQRDIIDDKTENISGNTEIPYKVYHAQNAGTKNRFSFRGLLIGASSGVVGLAVFGILFLFWPIIVQEARYRLVLSQQTTAVSDQTFPGFPQGDQWAPSNTEFSIVVPKIDAKAPIIADVDAGDNQAYLEALKKGVAQAKGTCFPGMSCSMYLFAHSAGSPLQASRYNAVFYLLGKLEKGDQILIYYKGKKILYDVTGKEIVGATETKYLTDTGNEEKLILQTCDPPGTTLNRLLVFAKPRLVEYLK